MKEYLTALRQNGTALCVASATAAPLMEACLSRLGVGDGSCVRVLDAGHIRRGYADLAGDLRRLGADCRAGRTGTEAGRQTKKL